ncbi:MAG: hypothetical protein JWP27_1718 [Flaviaesturariibacter sp.]|nr:hypothetical protein [Flaviaesturariibacter sp.]
MEHSTTSEVTFTQHHSDAEFRSRVRKTTILLSVITIIELIIGLVIYKMHKGDHPSEFLIMLFKGVVCILTLAKAFYIVSVFMHLGDEVRNLIMTIIVPLMLFVWFIGAFLWDGGSYRKLRNRYHPVIETPARQGEHEKSDTATHPLD